MHKERLLLVAKALRESAQPDKFAMWTYHRCGTPACAVGHYAARRDLQDFMQLAVDRDTGSLRFGVWGATKLANDYWDYNAAICSHFDITPDQREELFGADGCGDAETANQAARYIERFVADNA